MRQARKRALSRRKPHQIGFGITLSVFLSLMGLILFERIMLAVIILGLAYNPAPDTTVFLYGSDSKIGPSDLMLVALGGLLLAQSFRAVQAWRRKEASWSGLTFSLCNIGMIALLGMVLLINWAFHNPLSPGAPSVNQLSNLVRNDFAAYEPYEERPRAPGWEQLDGQTFCHAGAGIVERLEVIKPSFPIEHQRANYLARNNGQLEFFSDGTRSAKHYYDLDWNLLTIDASTDWPTVRAKLEDAGKEPYNLEHEIWVYLESLRHNSDGVELPSCAGRVSRPFPAPTYPPPQE